MSKSVKKFLLYLLSAITVSVLVISFYIYFPKKFESIDNTLRDYMFIVRGELQNHNNVIIIDIDEKSLQQEGQWPWSRDKLANLVNNLTTANAGIIGFDMLFPEEDRTSPSKLVKAYSLKTEQNIIPDYDKIFAYTLKNSPSILGYQFHFGKTIYQKKTPPKIPAVIIQKNKPEILNSLITAQGVLLNTPLIQNNVYSSGFVNNLPDEAGMTRSVPLVIEYDGVIYPSLALEIIRNIFGVKNLILNYDKIGLFNIQIGKDLTIPTDIYGRMIVNYRGAQNNFLYLSATDIINKNFDPKLIDGKVVLIGTSASGLFDLRSTPYDFIFPGVEVHANVIDNILTEDFIYKPSWVYGADIFIIVAISLLLILLIAYSSLWIIPIIVALFFIVSTLVLYKVLFSYGIILHIFFVYLTIIVSTLVALSLNYFYENRQSRIIKNKFANKVSKEVMQEIIEQENTTILQGKEKEITIFFSDIRGFTSISEAMPNAQALIDYLNLYMEPMTNIIINEKGTVDKYIGDAVMAYWNAPYNVSNHADKAVSAALKQIEYLEDLNNKYKQKNLPTIEIGIGINTGIAVVGEMGSKIRNDYTVIGDSVNLASRVESLCKQYGAKIIITEYVKEKLKKPYTLRVLDLVKVKGKTEPVEIFEVLNVKEIDEELLEQLNLYHKGVSLYRNAQFIQAIKIFEDILESKYKVYFERICPIYIDRCNELVNSAIKDFDGIYTYMTK